MNIGIIGLGYVGVTTMLSFAQQGFRVFGVDINSRIINKLSQDGLPFYEKDLQPLLEKYSKNVNFYSDISQISENLDIVFICVGTPKGRGKSLNLSQINNSLRQIKKKYSKNSKPIHISLRSTIPVGTMSKIKNYFSYQKDSFILSYNPEFLREGNALNDIKNPEVIVVGHENDKVKKIYKTLYKKNIKKIHFVPFKESELIKSTNNAWHALKVCFANELSQICSSNNIDHKKLIKMFLADKVLNISSAYLKPGFPYGGSCLEKDSDYLSSMSKKSSMSLPIISNINKSNQLHLSFIRDEIIKIKPKCVTFTSLTFKEDTDDVRNSMKIKLAEDLFSNKINVKLYDKVLSNMIQRDEKKLESLISSSDIFKYIFTDFNKAIMKSDIALVFSDHKKLTTKILKINPKIMVKCY